MADRLRWGILSTARIGVRRLIPALLRSRTGIGVAIASRDLERAREIAAKFDIPRAHGSYEALLADPDVDAVYNPLPNSLHPEWTIRAAQAGKHVLCEKPLAVDAARAQAMVDACRRAGTLLQEAFMYRYHPQIDELTALNLDFVASAQNSDVRRFDEILAPEFYCSNPDKSLVDRAAFLEQTAKPVAIKNLQAHDVKIRIMGHFAIIHAATSYTTPDGQQAHGRYTDCWAKQNGKWLAVSAHVTR